MSIGSSHQVISVMPQPGKGRQISTIDQWTSAFLVFGAVYIPSDSPTQRFPHPACLNTVRLSGILPGRVRCLHGINMTSNFATSDTQTLKASSGISPDGTCFLNVCMSSKSRGSGRAPATLSHKPARHIQPFPAGYCWGYQLGNKCTATQCKFKHVCAKCQLPLPASLCRQHILPHTSKPRAFETGRIKLSRRWLYQWI